MSDDTSTLPASRRLGGAAVLAGFVVAVVAMMIVPLPTPVLDVLLTLNLALSVTLLLVAVYSARTLELSTFPTVLVLTTLYRLALNVSTVRLILLQADAGRVVHAFGSFVVRGDYVVGFAVFLVLTIVQYVVIARGAERVAEVAARFTLDAMPGQQLAIDAELRSGAIDAQSARTRRVALGREAQLYGALDGAMRFVKGDAVASLLILGISLVGGLIVGVVEHNRSIGDAARLYTLLTIGDGLVSQLPALLISTAAGLVVTRVASDQAGATLAPDLARQFLRPRALAATAIFLGAMALVPGLPLWPFAAVGVGTVALALVARRRATAMAAGAAADTTPARAAALEVALAPQLMEQLGSQLAARLRTAASTVGDDLGLPLPGLEVRADARLPVRGWEVRLRGLPLVAGTLPDGRILAVAAPAAIPAGIEAEAASHPGSRALAAWVPTSAAPRLRDAGIDLLDPEACLVLAVDASLRGAASELLGLDETQRLLDALQARHPALVRELVPKKIEAAQLAELLRRLVAEDVPLGDLRDVLEAIAREAGADPADAGTFIERVRARLARRITHRVTRDGRAITLSLDGSAEDAIRGALRDDRPGGLALEPDFADAILASLRQEREQHPDAILVVPPDLRRAVRSLVEAEHPRLPVVAYNELLPDVELDRVGTIRA
jgi:type III secretory pathway component EscV